MSKRKYGSRLFDEIIDLENLKLAHKKASKDKAHYKEVQFVNRHLDLCLKVLRNALIKGTYHPNKYIRKIINENGKERVIMKPRYYPDRIVQHAIMNMLEPYFLKRFHYFSCASIPNAGTSRAFKLSQIITKYKHRHTKFCLKMDIKKCYPSIDKNILSQILRKHISCQRTLNVLDRIIFEFPDSGIPIGSLTSQYFANIYLHELDNYMKHDLKIKYVVRYADDICIYSSRKLDLHHYFEKINKFVNEQLNIQIKNNWRIIPVKTDGVDFVGYVFRGTHIKLRKRVKVKMEKIARRVIKRHASGKLISYHYFCSLNSYLGFLQKCDGYNLFQKYMIPCIPTLTTYYKKRILTSPKLSNYKRQKRTTEYYYRLLNKKYLFGLDAA